MGLSLCPLPFARSLGAGRSAQDDGGAAKGTGNGGPFCGEKVSVGAVGELGRDGEVTLAFVEIATACDELIILDEGTVVAAAGACGWVWAFA